MGEERDPGESKGKPPHLNPQTTNAGKDLLTVPVPVPPPDPKGERPEGMADDDVAFFQAVDRGDIDLGRDGKHVEGIPVTDPVEAGLVEGDREGKTELGAQELSRVAAEDEDARKVEEPIDNGAEFAGVPGHDEFDPLRTDSRVHDHAIRTGELEPEPLAEPGYDLPKRTEEEEGARAAADFQSDPNQGVATSRDPELDHQTGFVPTGEPVLSGERAGELPNELEANAPLRGDGPDTPPPVPSPTEVEQKRAEEGTA